MSKSGIQKLKTLYVAKFFLENCDDNHSVLAGDIPNFLKGECDINVDRRSIYREMVDKVVVIALCPVSFILTT